MRRLTLTDSELAVVAEALREATAADLLTSTSHAVGRGLLDRVDAKLPSATDAMLVGLPDGYKPEHVAPALAARLQREHQRPPAPVLPPASASASPSRSKRSQSCCCIDRQNPPIRLRDTAKEPSRTTTSSTVARPCFRRSQTCRTTPAWLPSPRHIIERGL
jgi:hypothetical protein